MKRYGEIEKAELALNTAQNSFLRQRGWVMTCANPGSLWLWEKDINGKMFVCNRDVAVHIARTMELLKL